MAPNCHVAGTQGYSLQKRIRNTKTGPERRKEDKTKIRKKKKKLARKEGKKPERPKFCASLRQISVFVPFRLVLCHTKVLL